MHYKLHRVSLDMKVDRGDERLTCNGVLPNLFLSLTFTLLCSICSISIRFPCAAAVLSPSIAVSSAIIY